MKSIILTSKLVARFRQGDHKAYEIVFNAYYNLLCAFAARMLDDNHAAEDQVEDVFVKLWEKHAGIDLTEAYLNTMVINACLNYIQHRKVMRKAGAELSCTIKPEEDPTEAIRRLQVEAHFEAYIYEGMFQMTPKVRIVFCDAYHGRLTTKEIAARYGLSVKTVQLQLRIAVNILNAYFESQV